MKGESKWRRTKAIVLQRHHLNGRRQKCLWICLDRDCRWASVGIWQSYRGDNMAIKLHMLNREISWFFQFERSTQMIGVFGKMKIANSTRIRFFYLGCCLYLGAGKPAVFVWVKNLCNMNKHENSHQKNGYPSAFHSVDFFVHSAKIGKNSAFATLLNSILTLVLLIRQVESWSPLCV